ncbi:MAG: DUF4105 domain-containing protein [Bacteroidales bacterium]
MKKVVLALFLILVILHPDLKSQESPKAEVYFLTCGPGLETYSVYGHSALRVVIPDEGSDLVFNWGVFDFNTRNFTWKFAKGRLDYMLGAISYESFLKDYINEKRWVISQKVNLEEAEIQKLFTLINENLKPENIKYRYDFFYDDCSTRIRDLFEKAVGDDLLYPLEEPKSDLRTFRQLTGEFQKGFPWYKFGVDLIMGSPGDKKASFRDMMFLPVYLQSGLSKLVIRREGKMIPLLRDPEVVVDSGQAAPEENFFTSPIFVFSLLLVILIAMTGLLRERKFNRLLDTFLFTLFSILAVMMIFFNFFTDHQQMRWNLNIIWLSPFTIVCLASLILNRDWKTWFRVVFFLSVACLALSPVLPQHLNNAFAPLIGIVIIRSSIRAGFSWNPLTLPYLTEL